jgi:hypothetical protein
MELDELKQAWSRLSVRQDSIEALLRNNHREQHLDKVRSMLGRSITMRAMELLVWIAFTAAVASFWVDHRHVVHWVVIGVVLHIYGIAAIWASATQLLLLTRIRLFDAPVLMMQKRLAQLRRFRFYASVLLGLPWWCLWLLVTAVGATWLTGIDFYTATAPGWFWSALGVGIIGIGASLWLARKLAGRPIASPLLREMIDNISGCNLRRAWTQLDQIARFERE